MKKLFKLRYRYQSSIYGQVVLTITILSIFLFVSFGIIFRSVNEGYLNTVIRQSGNNMGSIVEGALYHSMLANDRSALQNTLDVINGLPGIEDVNMYDNQDKLIYSSLSTDPYGYTNPNCTDCHSNINSMFPRDKKSFRIINVDSECEMSRKNYDFRLLLIRYPILNDPVIQAIAMRIVKVMRSSVHFLSGCRSKTLMQPFRRPQRIFTSWQL